MSTHTEWFLWADRDDGTYRRAIVAGPYATQAAADAKRMDAIRAVEEHMAGGSWAWFWKWGCCEAPAGTLTAKLGML